MDNMVPEEAREKITSDNGQVDADAPFSSRYDPPRPLAATASDCESQQGTLVSHSSVN